jgi:hypothetical protein
MNKEVKLSKVQEWIMERVKGDDFCTWHLNDKVLDFKEEFCKDESFETGVKRLRYNLQQLEKKGLLKSHWVGTDCGGRWDFGTTRLKYWREAKVLQ